VNLPHFFAVAGNVVNRQKTLGCLAAARAPPAVCVQDFRPVRRIQAFVLLSPPRNAFRGF
jgi:hypothetical protein